MATYQELFALQSDDALRDKVYVATVIAAQTKLAGTPSAEEAAWAVNVLGNPKAEGLKVLRLVLAANESASVAQIQGATDAAIQANVDAVIDGLVLGA